MAARDVLVGARSFAPRRAPVVRTWRRGAVRVTRTPTFVAVALVLATALIALGTVRWPEWVPASTFGLVVVVGGYFLRLQHLLVLLVAVTGALVYVTVARMDVGSPPVNRGVVVVLVATGLVMLSVARGREKLGLQGGLGATMLVDLRDRLRAQGELPELPPGWQAETALRSAYGDSFSGDFLVASRSTDGRLLEIALVDVSGKGAAAGTRALLLSGAFGGLLGAMTPPAFLPAANQYLLRQRWEEGFATAIHLALDLSTGEFRLASAGHPPAAHFRAGSGRWDVISRDSGPLLGVLDTEDFPGVQGRLDRGDALLLYTDGVVEIPGRDLDVGIDRMIGQAERLVTHGFRDGARRLVDLALAGETDDRALVLIWRT